MSLYYDLDRYYLEDGKTYNGYINEAVDSIRKGNNAEYYKDTLFRMTYPIAITELKKYSNYDDVEELLPIMSIAFMKTIDKYDPENPNVSFINYYKMTMRNDIIIAYTKCRGNKELREYAKKCENTKAYLDELVPISKYNFAPLYTLVEDKFIIDDEIICEDLKKTIFRIIDNMFKSPREEKKKKIFKAYITDRLEGRKTNRSVFAKEFDCTQSYASRVINSSNEKLAVRLRKEGYYY